MTIKRLIAIALIVGCTSFAWFLLAGALQLRTASSESRLSPEVAQNWGPELKQEHPQLFYLSPTDAHTRRELQPEQTQIAVQLSYEPKRKGLLWHRTYFANFTGEYRVRNPLPIAQTIYVAFRFPSAEARYDQFTLRFGHKVTDKAPNNGEIHESLMIPPGAEVPLKVTYRAAGTGSWSYLFNKTRRVKNLHLAMTTDFREINVPAGAESPTTRDVDGAGWRLNWDYTDVIGANAIAMDMPAVTNPGEVAKRMTCFAPVSLLFYFSVLVILSMARGVQLHPMNYFLLAAGCFAFQLLFAYLVDLLPLLPSFLVSAAVSVTLVNGYLWRAAGRSFAQLSAVAQTAYMVLFSYSFFFEGLTGITITIGAIITLALLMAFTARINWSRAFQAPLPQPPPIPGAA
jgi:hypothetical protein